MVYKCRAQSKLRVVNQGLLKLGSQLPDNQCLGNDRRLCRVMKSTPCPFDGKIMYVALCLICKILHQFHAVNYCGVIFFHGTRGSEGRSAGHINKMLDVQNGMAYNHVQHFSIPHGSQFYCNQLVEFFLFARANVDDSVANKVANYQHYSLLNEHKIESYRRRILGMISL